MKNIIFLCIALFCLSCEQNSDSINTGDFSTNGQGGSLARFSLKDNYLYTVDEFDLNVFSLENPGKPVQVNTQSIGLAIKTLFSYEDYLYIGSRNGMFIYDVQNPEFPNKLSEVQHFTACDPVVANEKYAFVTLQNSSGCGGSVNQLEVYDVTDVTAPILINTRRLSFPKGLGLYGNYLIVCDDKIKVFDITDPENSKLVSSLDTEAFDVIIQGNLLIAIGETGLYQYQLNKLDMTNIKNLSTIRI